MSDECSAGDIGLAEQTKLAAELKLEIESLERDVKARKEKYSQVSEEILKTLDALEMESVRAHGFLFYKENKSSVTTPKSSEAKEELFEFLRAKGLFTEMVSVNSMTLNALYKSLAQEAAESGNLGFRLPGVDEPTIYTTLKLRRS